MQRHIILNYHCQLEPSKKGPLWWENFSITAVSLATLQSSARTHRAFNERELKVKAVVF